MNYNINMQWLFSPLDGPLSVRHRAFKKGFFNDCVYHQVSNQRSWIDGSKPLWWVMAKLPHPSLPNSCFRVCVRSMPYIFILLVSKTKTGWRSSCVALCQCLLFLTLCPPGLPPLCRRCCPLLVSFTSSSLSSPRAGWAHLSVFAAWSSLLVLSESLKRKMFVLTHACPLNLCLARCMFAFVYQFRKTLRQHSLVIIFTEWLSMSLFQWEGTVTFHFYCAAFLR